jgi:hypothetical protein
MYSWETIHIHMLPTMVKQNAPFMVARSSNLQAAAQETAIGGRTN